MKKIVDEKVKTIFLVKDIGTHLPTDISNRLLYDYELCEVVDMNNDGIYELLVKRKYYEGIRYQVYQFKDNGFSVVIENGSEI